VPKSFVLTPRDTELLTELGEVGMMTARMLVERHYPGFANPESAQRAFRRRAQRFVANKLVSVERVPTAAAAGNGVLRVYRLTREGGDLLAELTGHRPRRAGSSPPLHPVTVPHRLGIVATRLAFDDAHRLLGLPIPEWLFEYDLAPSASPTAGNDDKFILYESFRSGGKRHVCWPDAAARIRLDGKTPHDLLAYLEYDRSTEGRRQIAAKSEPYQLLVNERRYERHWSAPLNNPLVRIMFVARSEQRVQHVITAIQDTPGAQLFRFATYDDLQPERILTEPIWRTIDNKRLSILRPNSVPVARCSLPCRATIAKLETVSRRP